MNSPHLLILLGGVAGILVLASIIGAVLRLKLSPDGANPVIENLIARINAWWVMVILMSIAFVAGKTGVVLLFALCSFAALREFLSLTTYSRSDHLSLAASFFIVLPFQYWLILTDWYGLYSIYVPVYVFLLLPVVSALRGNPTNFLIRVSEMQWA